ncbi:hypothetical protein O0235_10855 [Tepidiforma flava]|uniref:CN hydrolase domain-containing protein n=1 Tax=Tepidiforma flava TaxID=3004094 RepID=A0ABY7M402_9CHLR|nr:nitrilase-related carbon-nitrogen hydrolase [Tepidiforma flava]WBL35279.1 hypothetical protein O0235_10855 [Tepidiforma flava]
MNINASPYHRGKARERERMLAYARGGQRDCGGVPERRGRRQDELVFDGASVVVDAEGRVIARARQFAEELLVADVDLDEVAQRRLHDPRRRVELRARDWVTGAEAVELGFALETSREPARAGGAGRAADG